MKFEVVVPVFNEAECIRETTRRILTTLDGLSGIESRVIFVDDGSSDTTYRLLTEESAKDKRVSVIKLSRNFGHQIAVTAGLDSASADFIGIIDGDLQDPPELFPVMLEKALSGFDIVYGKRVSREGETLFKKVSAAVFYRYLNKMCDVDIPKDTGDFRVISKKTLEMLRSMREKHRFLRGMVPYIGLPSYAFEYHRKARFGGKTKYPFTKMARFALDATFSFSSRPIKIVRYIGIISIFLSIILGIYWLTMKIAFNAAVPGFTAIVTCVVFFGGVQTLAISIIGEYVGRIFEEVKQRPLYFIEKKIN